MRVKCARQRTVTRLLAATGRADCAGRLFLTYGLKPFAQLAEDGARLAAADRPAVAFHDRDDLGGGAGQEELVGGVHVVPQERHFAHR